MSARSWSCGQFFPLAGWSEAVEIDERNSVEHGVANLDDTAESGQSLLVDLFMRQEFRIIEKIAEEPAELPHRFLRAVKTTDDGVPGQTMWLNNGESENVEGSCGVPAELGVINPNEVDAVGNLLT